MVAGTLKLEGVSKYFGSRRAVHAATLEVRPGERVAVMGGNGSGKSTLLAIASGVLDADRGLVERPPAIGYAPEKPDIPDHLLVVEWLDVVGSLKRGKLRDTDELGIHPLLGRRVSALSLGERQRVSLCAAFLGEPPLFVLDEPTNALDHGARMALIERLQGATILLATHDAELVRSLEARVIQMKEGQIMRGEGPTAE